MASPVVTYALLSWPGLSSVCMLCSGSFGLGTLPTPEINAREIEFKAQMD